MLSAIVLATVITAITVIALEAVITSEAWLLGCKFPPLYCAAKEFDRLLYDVDHIELLSLQIASSIPIKYYIKFHGKKVTWQHKEAFIFGWSEGHLSEAANKIRT